MNAAKDIQQVGMRLNDLMIVEQFSLHKLYHQLKGHYDNVPWRRMVCNNSGAPKWTIMLILAAHNKLYTTMANGA